MMICMSALVWSYQSVGDILCVFLVAGLLTTQQTPCLYVLTTQQMHASMFTPKHCVFLFCDLA